MKMAAAVQVFISLLLILHFSRGYLDGKVQTHFRQYHKAHKSSDHSIYTSFIVMLSLSPESFVSLLLLGLTIILSATIYLWVFRYICIGCCQPVAIESESLAGMV